MNILKSKEYLRSILFGIEDSLVSTTGLIAGISIGSDNKKFVILGGIVAVAIEAVSMGVGEYLSDDAIEDFEKLKHHKDNSLLSGLLMFSSYFLAGLIPLAPICIFNFPLSSILSILFALISLFLLGYIKGKIVKISPIKSGLKIFFLGGLATILGLVVGLIFRVRV
jgi:VIT1/CCC1 family predicted Fe2+/Mn2+ transporter